MRECSRKSAPPSGTVGWPVEALRAACREASDPLRWTAPDDLGSGLGQLGPRHLARSHADVGSGPERALAEWRRDVLNQAEGWMRAGGIGHLV